MGASEQQSSCQLQVLVTQPQVQGAKGWRMPCTWCKQRQPWIPPEEAPPVPPWGARTLLGALVAQRPPKLTARMNPSSTPNHQQHGPCKAAEPCTHRGALHPSIRPLQAAILLTSHWHLSYLSARSLAQPLGHLLLSAPSQAASQRTTFRLSAWMFHTKE